MIFSSIIIALSLADRALAESKGEEEEAGKLGRPRCGLEKTNTAYARYRRSLLLTKTFQTFGSVVGSSSFFWLVLAKICEMP